MPKTSDIVLGGNVFGLFTGDPGTGKTVAIGSFPEPIYFVDLDGRMAPLRKMYPTKEIEYDTFGPHDFLKFRDKMAFLQDENHGFKTIALDSLTAMARMIMNYMIDLRGSGSAREKGFKQKGVIPLAEIEDFGGESRGLGQIMDICRVLKQTSHVIVTAHWIVTTTKDLKSGRDFTARTLLTGGKKIAAEIPAYFDEIWDFSVSSGMGVGDPAEFVVSTTRNEYNFAKTALPLPTEIKWTMKKGDKGLFEIIQREVAKDDVKLGGGEL